ncbi:MAG: ATP-binding protein [Desulfatirhabdiaceae bacterium]
MNIDQIQLTHIGCYSQKTFEFPRLTVVHGENRSGKSTLVYALFWSLFGKHLQPGLQPGDLCQKGKPEGQVALTLSHDHSVYRLERTTPGAIQLFQPSQADVPVQQAEMEIQTRILTIPADVAALTSFFREGEMITFLSDMSRYSQTMLEKMMKMDNIIILHKRLGKAVALARTNQKNIRQSGPPGLVDDVTLTTYKKQLVSLDAEYNQVDADIRNLAQSSGKRIDFKLLNFLQLSCEEKRKELDSVSRLKKDFPDTTVLEAQRAEIEKSLAELNANPQKTDELQRQIGVLDHQIDGIRSELKRFLSLENQPDCHVCGQPISSDHLRTMIAEHQQAETERVGSRKQVAKTLEDIIALENHRRRMASDLKELDHKLNESRRLDGQYTRIHSEIEKSEHELNEFKPANIDMENITAVQSRIQELEARRETLQQQIIQKKVAVKQMENDINRSEDVRKRLKTADRHVLLCEVAHQAVENAMSFLNRDMLRLVRTSLKEWVDRFTFLNRFDIDMSSKSFSPLIQARGYEYKLNQMSKSERVFLYLLVKLAIGDALGHLGVFVLDDPADGLDRKRKELMAHLLQNVSTQRQIIVTTNDDDFAAHFPASACIRLDETSTGY